MKKKLHILFFLLISNIYTFGQKVPSSTSELQAKPINRNAVYADRYSFIPVSEYEDLLIKKNNFTKVDSSNADKLAMIETYIYLYQWEEQNKRPISTLSKYELEKLVDKQLDQNLSIIFRSVK
jgi:hypothetical protein